MKPKKGKSFNPLDSYRPLEEVRGIKGKKKIHIPGKIRVLFGIGACLILIFFTFVLGQYFEPVHTALGYVTQPIQNAYSSISNWITEKTEQFQNQKALQEENRRLKEQLDELAYQNTILENDLAQLRELQELWNLSNYYEAYPKTAAQIVGLSPNNWYETFIVDKGTDQDLKKYMPVIAGSGLVGHISQVFSNYARVTSIVEESSRIYGQVNRYQQSAKLLVQGGQGLKDSDTSLDPQCFCYADFITAETDIQVGDEIVTSALGDIYPPGLLIGTVEEIVSLNDGRTSRAFIKPAVNPESMNFVLIITDLWKEDMKQEIEGDSE